MERIFSYAFTTAGRRSSSRHGRSGDGGANGNGDGGGPYAAQQHVGAGGAVAAGNVDFFWRDNEQRHRDGLGYHCRARVWVAHESTVRSILWRFARLVLARWLGERCVAEIEMFG